MYGEFEQDLINELQETNRKLDQMVCYASMILRELDTSSKNYDGNKEESDD